MRLGVIGHPEDPHCTRMVEEICRRGHDAILIDTGSGLASHRFSLDADGCRYDGDSLRDVRVFFLRNVVAPIPSVYVQDQRMRLYDDWNIQYMRAKEKHGFILSWLLELVRQGSHLLNAPQWGMVGQLKPFHTASLLQADLPMPATLMTNDPAEARAFLERHPQAIYKPVMGGDYARRVDDAVRQRLDVIEHSPVILQACIDGTSVRVTMAADRILSVCQIPSDAIDFRGGSAYGGGRTRYEPHDLPAEIQDLCFRAIRAAGYGYTAIDLMFAFPHEYYFLEANYAPAFAALETATGHAITPGLVDYMERLSELAPPLLEPTPFPTLFDYRYY
jgi:glutathione synthase/RimK-type ligase-like ATP-grasp enzyme